MKTKVVDLLKSLKPEDLQHCFKQWNARIDWCLIKGGEYTERITFNYCYINNKSKFKWLQVQLVFIYARNVFRPVFNSVIFYRCLKNKHNMFKYDKYLSKFKRNDN